MHKQPDGKENTVLIEAVAAGKTGIELLEAVACTEQKIRTAHQHMAVSDASLGYEALEIVGTNTGRIARIGHHTEGA